MKTEKPNRFLNKKGKINACEQYQGDLDRDISRL